MEAFDGPSSGGLFFSCVCSRDDGTISIGPSYIDPDEAKKAGKIERSQTRKMKEAGDIFRIVGIVLLVIFVLAVGIPLVLTAAGVALSLIGMLVGLAILLIKVAIVVAIIYLIIVGIRAVLR
jgi:hypothetical protein